MTIEFIDKRDGVVGEVIHEIENAVLAKTPLPRRGEEVQLPRRNFKEVSVVRYCYGKRGLLKVQVIVQDRPRGRRG